jgi:heme/copper-type cytochrome/quinol oxidase subunit 2
MYGSLILLFTLIVMATSLGVLIFLRQENKKQENHLDSSAWFLVILLIVAFVSIISFIAFIFLRGRVG